MNADARAAAETLRGWLRRYAANEAAAGKPVYDAQGKILFTSHSFDASALTPPMELDEVAALYILLAELREQDDDTRAVAEAWSYFADEDAPPRGMRDLYDQFADRIAALNDLGAQPSVEAEAGA